jgi:hypothetical protein
MKKICAKESINDVRFGLARAREVFGTISILKPKSEGQADL